MLGNRTSSRPYHHGTYPFEALAKDRTVAGREARRAPNAPTGPDEPASRLARIAQHYLQLCVSRREGEPAAQQAPVPDDLERRSIDIKGYGYFLDAAHVGICEIPDNAWLSGQEGAHRFAIVVVVEDGRMPEADNLAHRWLDGAVKHLGHLRSTEIAVCIAGYIRQLGFTATAHCAVASEVDLEKLAVLAGVVARDGDGVVSPFIGREFTIAAVATDYALAADQPLASNAPATLSLRYWLGINGAMSGRERNRRAHRMSHLSRYPMEQVKRVDRPTTLIVDDEVPRMPKRADFFARAGHGDLGAKTAREVKRFIDKSPHNVGLLAPMMSFVPFQDGPVADRIADDCRDAAANAKAIKSLGYHMGADLVGICEVPRYAWYSHNGKGEPIDRGHRYAVCMLIDQGFDTMEGASGDDWISGAQSIRAYMRGGEIAGVMAALVRELGYPARSHTAIDSEVLHIPLLLWAGLGELSRIGELVLNPYVGPRFKSVVFTTDMPLEVDKPIDFGLQYFCSNCLKCARECPCDAMPFGDKVMFNGYEMWKPDVERCARYRITNPRGAACGRCMKTCPLNKVPSADGPIVHRIGTWLGVNARFLKPLLVPIAVYLDDKLGYGRRNPAKKWWLDLEVVDGICQEPRKGSNERELDIEREIRFDTHKVAYYPARVAPDPTVEGSQPLDRKAALAEVVETPEHAYARTHAASKQRA